MHSTINESFLSERQQQINAYLEQLLPATDTPPTTLHEAMRYAVLQGGKRIRPILTLVAAQSLNTPLEKVLSAACALELIHAYSLIHDDLPAMDNDDWRRGIPTCHKTFNEATAILAGDALQTLAFDILADARRNPITPEQRLEILRTVALACGSKGMAGGQAMDLSITGKTDVSLEIITTMHQLKTGVLFSAAMEIALIAAQPSEKIRVSFRRYATALGLAFQIYDDLLDIKEVHRVSEKERKSTYPSIAGVEVAKEKVQALHQEALEALSETGMPFPLLVNLSEYLLSRKS